MSYTPINTAVYVAAFSGAISGIAVNGWIISPALVSYDSATKIAGAFAEAFDIAWNSALDLDSLDEKAITQVCAAQFAKHAPPSNQSQYQTRTNWTEAANACVALVLECAAYFASQGIIPGPSGGGGNGTYLPVPEQFMLPGESVVLLDATDAWGPVIMRALALAPGHAITLTNGKAYRSVTEIVLGDGYSIICANNGASIALGDAAPNNINLMSGTSKDGIVIKGFKFFGNLKLDGGSLYGNGLMLNNCTNFDIEDVNFVDISIPVTTALTAGLCIKGTSSKGRVFNCRSSQSVPVTGAGCGGILQFGSNGIVDVLDCEVDCVNLKVGIWTEGSPLGKINRNTIYNGDVHSIQLGYNDAILVNNAECCENVIYNSAWTGIYYHALGTIGWIVNDNVLAFCGGGDNTLGIGTASVWVSGTELTLNGNYIYAGGYTPGGVARSGLTAPVYSPSTATAGLSGPISSNIIRSIAAVPVLKPGIWLQNAFDVVVGLNLIVGYVFSINIGPRAGTDYQIAIRDNVLRFDTTFSAVDTYYAISFGTLKVDCQGNSIYGNGVNLSRGFNVDGNPTGIISNNTINNCFYGGVLIHAETLGYTLFVENNTFYNASTGVRGTFDAGTPWLMVGPNRYINCTNKVTANSFRLRTYLQLEPRRIVVSDAAPTAGQLPGQRVGDMIILNPVVGHAAIKNCVNAAGDPGTWETIVSL